MRCRPYAVNAADIGRRYRPFYRWASMHCHSPLPCGRAWRAMWGRQARTARPYSVASATVRSKMSPRPPSARQCQSRWVGCRPVPATA